MTGVPLLLLSLLLWMSPVSSTLPVMLTQNNTNSITGQITDTSGKPLNRMRVELLDEVDMMVTQTYTNPAGSYSFRGLSQGTFTVKVHTNGTYLTRSVRVSIYALRARGGSHQEQLDIVMKSREEAKGPSVPTNSGPTFVQEVPDNARKTYERAVKQLDNEKQADQGMQSLKEAISLFPTYYAAMERLGVEQVKRQQYDPARETLSKAIEVNPNGAPCLYALGVVHYQAKQWPESVESLRRSLTLAPGSPNAAFAHFYLGLGFLKTGKAEDAETHFKRAFEMGGNNIPADGHMHLAQLYSNSKRYKEAADELESFLRQTPDARDADNIKNIIKQLRAKAKATTTSAHNKLVASSTQ